MDNTEAYSFLFADTLMDALILPPHTAYALKVMLGFGGYSPFLMLLCVSFGMMAGSTANWLLGRALITCRNKEWVIVETPKVDKCTAFFKNYLSWLLMLAWFPGLGAVLAVISGFAMVRVWVFWVWAGIGIITFYALILF